jgi:hypothetical protein
MSERGSAVSRLLPFLRAERRIADERMESAIAAVCARHPELAGREVGWFGGRLQNDSRGRYHAVGYLADPDIGLEEGRAFIVDVVGGHVMRELPIERRIDLPADVSALA